MNRFTQNLYTKKTKKDCGDELFTHTSVRTSNMEKSIGFYTRLLGLKLLNRHEIAQNNAEVAFLQDPEGQVRLVFSLRALLTRQIQKGSKKCLLR